MLRFHDHASGESRARFDASMVLPTVSGQAATLHPLDTTAEAADLTPFLDQIMHRLSRLPTDMHGEIRREMRAHLESLIAAHEELGLDRADATLAATNQFGDSATIARRFRRAYESTLPVATPWAAMRAAMLVFGVGMPLYVAASAGTAPLFFFSHLLTTMLLWLFPVLAGSWIGWQRSRRAALGVLYGLAALTTLALPIMIGRAYQIGNVAAVGATASNESVLRLIECIVCWTPLACLAAAVTSRLKGVRVGQIETLPVFLLYAAGISLLSYAAVTTIEAGLYNAHLLSPEGTEFLSLPLRTLFIWGAPLWAGGRIGKEWPLLEKWNRKTLTYLLGSALTIIAGGMVIPLIMEWISLSHRHHSLFSMTPSKFVALFLNYFFFTMLPMVAIVALVAANKARGENPRWLRGVTLAVLGYGLAEGFKAYLYAQGFTHFPGGKVVWHLPVYMPLFDCILPAALIVLLWVNHRRLPRWKTLFAAGKERHASL